MLSDVDCGTVKRLKGSIFKNRNAHAANVPYFPVWSNNPVSYVAATAMFMHRPEGFRHRGSVIRVEGGQILLKVWRPVLWVKAKNFVYFVRPIDIQIVGPTDAQIVGRPASHVSQ